MSVRQAISTLKHILIVLLLLIPSALHISLGGVLCGASSSALVWNVLAPTASACFMANEDGSQISYDTNTAWPSDQVALCSFVVCVSVCMH